MAKTIYSTLLFAFLTMQLFPSKADWAVQIATSDRVTVKDIVIDAEGYNYSTGMFYDTLIVSSATNSDTLIDKRFGETFIIKMDSCGNLIWAKQFFGQSNTSPNNIALNSQGHIIITGTFAATTDFDPSSNTYLVDPDGGNAIYITILDNDGNFISVGRLGGSPGMYTPNVAIDDSDNIYINAAFSGGAGNVPVDVDPSLKNTFMLTPNGIDGVILKLNPQGNLDWVYHVGGSGYQIFAGDITTNGSEVSAAFHFWGQVSFDTGSGTQTLQSKTTKYNGLVINLSSNKQYLGYSYLKGTENVITKAIVPSTNNRYYLSGYFTDSLTVQLNGQAHTLISEGNYDSYVSHWSANGNLLWIKQFSSEKDVFLSTMEVANNGNIYLTGIFQDTLSFNLGSNSLISKNKRNLFIAIFDPNGNFISAEKLNIETTLQNQFAIDSKGSIYGFSNYSNAFLKTYDGDTSFTKVGSQNSLLFKLSNEANRINLGTDKSICDTDSLILNPTLIAGDEIKWSTGEVTPRITVKQAGTYHVKVVNCGRVFRDTIVITTVPTPIVDLGADTIFCENQEFLIEPFVKHAKKYSWNTNDITKNLLVNKSGAYILKVENGSHCFVKDTINVEFKPFPKVFAFSDTVLCGLDEFILDAGNTGSSYSWSNGENSQKIIVKTDGVYSVEVDNSICSTTDSVKVTFLEEAECLPSISIPNVFTPNNDGINDFFKPIFKNISEIELRIYNRWGQLVFKSDTQEIHWDGRFQGNKVVEGNYMYVLQYSYSEWGKTETISKQLKGSVLLLR